MLLSTGLLRHGDRAAREVSGRIGGSVADRTALANLQKGARIDGMIAKVLTDRSEWVYDSTVSASDSTQNLIVTPADTVGGWLRVDNFFDLKIGFDFNKADAATLFTVPTGFKLNLLRLYWEVTTSFTGGASSAIGVSSSNASYNTKGDLLGGASGDVAATLVQTGNPYKGGTVGAKFASNGIGVLVAGDTLRFDRITSAFTAGVGFVHVAAQIIN